MYTLASILTVHMYPCVQPYTYTLVDYYAHTYAFFYPILTTHMLSCVQTYATPSTQSVDILGYQRLFHLIPCLCGMGCKRSLVLEMEVRDSVYLIIIIIIRLYIAINELMRRKTIFN